MKKDEIRRRVRARKSLLNEAEKAAAAEAVFAQLEQAAPFMMAEKILLYHSLADELSTHAFIDKWHERKCFYLPRVNGVDLDILPYDQSSLRLGAFYIEEPQGDDVTDVSEIELIIVPGVAYDRYGNRVGRGKGYYDRLLSQTKALKIGVAYDFQYLGDHEEIDCEPHDVRVDIVITDKGFYRTKRK